LRGGGYLEGGGEMGEGGTRIKRSAERSCCGESITWGERNGRDFVRETIDQEKKKT